MTVHTIRAGFMPLLDACILIVAHEKGFDADEGIRLQLHKETSWANIRDRISVGHFDAAHMLGPMPVAASAGVLPIPMDICVPFAMGLGGNAITVSREMAEALRQTGMCEAFDPARNGQALKLLIDQNTMPRRPVFAVVHPYSGHNYELRYWLAGCAMDPDRDVEIIVIPPVMMPDALRSGHIDGYCAGEPWNTVSVESGYGHILTVKSKIWRSSPEKVLGVRTQFNADHPEIVEALIRALYSAARWCDEAANSEEIDDILQRPAYLDVPAKTLLPVLRGDLADIFGVKHRLNGFFIPFDRAATFPWRSHALWIYSQMVRWGHAPFSQDLVKRVSATYRSDIYRNALKGMGADIPSASLKVEGALTAASAVGSTRSKLFLGPDGFFDGTVFDPDRIKDYVHSQSQNR